MNEPPSIVTILLTLETATILFFLLYFRSASTWQNDLKEKVAAQDVELIRLRSKITKLKLKLGSGRTKTAALRNLQQLRRTKLLELGVAHDDDDDDNNHNNETNPPSDVSFLSTTQSVLSHATPGAAVERITPRSKPAAAGNARPIRRPSCANLASNGRRQHRQLTQR